ncbi:MAG: acetolactate synthase large subunit, partial [Alphaproteobacteria bacterium]
MNGADRLTDVLLANDVNVCFANPGTSEMHFVAALDRRPQMRCILGLFEGVVTGAADGYARMTRKPAATLLHTGPGLANGLANIHNARKANSPVINIVGDHASYHQKYGAPLTTDVESVAAPMSDWVGRVGSADEVAETVKAALRAAVETPGVATLILPADAAWSDATAGGEDRIETALPQIPDEGGVREVALAIRANTDRFAILVGGEAALAEGLAIAGTVADAFGGRVIGEVLPSRIARGRGVYPAPSIPYPIDQAVEFLRDIDLLVLVGATEPVAFFAYPGKPSRFLQDHAKILTLANKGEDQPGGLRALADCLGATEPFERNLDPRLEVGGADGPLTAEAVCDVVAALLPDDCIVCEEGLTSTSRFHQVSAKAAPHEVLSVTGGSIGIGPPLATGAAVACPHRKVVGLQADGSALYTLQALWTQAREHLDVLTVLFSNRTYAILRWEMENLGYGEPGPNASRLFDLVEPELDWVKIANGFGVEAVSVDSRRKFTDAF